MLCPLAVAAPRLWVVVAIADLGNGAFTTSNIDPGINRVLALQTQHVEQGRLR